MKILVIGAGSIGRRHINNLNLLQALDSFTLVFLVEYYKMWKKTRFESNVAYTRTMRHYYGVNVEDTLFTKGKDLSDEANMHLYNQADVDLRFSRYKVRKNEAQFDFGLSYHLWFLP